MSSAIVLWSGYGETSVPVRDNSRLLRDFEPRQVLALMDNIRAAEEDFFHAATRSPADPTTEFRMRWPGLSDEAVEALGWCFASLGD